MVMMLSLSKKTFPHIAFKSTQLLNEDIGKQPTQL